MEVSGIIWETGYNCLIVTLKWKSCFENAENCIIMYQNFIRDKEKCKIMYKKTKKEDAI